MKVSFANGSFVFTPSTMEDLDALKAISARYTDPKKGRKVKAYRRTCKICGFIAYNAAGLAIHNSVKRDGKHKKPALTA